MSLAEKTLRELILPQDTREREVREFISDVKPGMSVDPVCITDVYGPTVVRPDFQCIVVSQETVKGSALINEQRGKNVSGDREGHCKHE